MASATAAEVPDCFLHGQGYNQTTGQAIRLETETAQLCQEECKRTEICAFFTWFNNSKGCWLQSSAATLSIVSDQVTSGPVRCLDNIKTGKIVGALNQSTGAAFPWWAWLFIGLLVAVGGLLCLACLCCTQNKRGKRSKRLQDEKSRDIEAAAASAEARVPLTGAAASNNQKDLFDMLDKDGDGQLSQAELMAARQMFAAGSPTAAPAYRSGSMAAVAPQAGVSVGPAVMLPPITVPPQAQPGHNYYVPVPAAVQVATGVPQEPTGP